MTRPTAFSAATSGTRTGLTTAPSDWARAKTPRTDRFDAGVEVVEVEILGETDAQAANRAAVVGNEVDHRVARRGWVAAVVAGDGIQHQGGIAHRARQRAHVIEAVGQGQGAVTAHAAIGGLEPHHAAKRGGDADGASGIAAHGGVDHLGGHRRARAAARPAGAVLEIPWIAHRPEVRIGRRDAVGHLVHVELAEHHRAGRPQPFHHGRVDGGDKIFIDLGAAGGAHAARREKVFHGDGDSVERPAVAPRGQLGIRLPRLFHEPVRR